MIISNWNEGKTKSQIRKVNKLIKTNIIGGKFRPHYYKFAKKLFKLGYKWSDDYNEVNNNMKDELYKFAFSFFEKRDILALPHGGTLLGFVRGGASLKHDDDHDMSVDFKKLALYFDEFENEIKVNNYELFFNKDIIKNGMNNDWYFITKIITKEKTKIIIGDYFFEIHNTIDLFPIIYFDNFDEFLKISSIYLNSYKNEGRDMKFNKSAINKRFDLIVNEFGVEDSNRLKLLSEQLYNDKDVIKKTSQELVDEFNAIYMNKNSGKYFTTLTTKLLYKKWRISGDDYNNIKLNNSLIYKAGRFDKEDLLLFYGEDWKKSPGFGPLHTLDTWSFKGRLNSKGKIN